MARINSERRGGVVLCVIQIFSFKGKFSRKAKIRCSQIPWILGIFKSREWLRSIIWKTYFSSYRETQRAFIFIVISRNSAEHAGAQTNKSF